jgi:hypothetical protein
MIRVTSNIFFLSMYDQYVSMILNGEKQWEFRENPRFGIHEAGELQSDDILFLVSTFPDANTSAKIKCMCRVTAILREKKLQSYFMSRQSGRWKEAGCNDDTARDWDFFVKNILHVYSTGIRLEAFEVSPVIDTLAIQHQTKDTSWNGRGFTPIRTLKRFTIYGTDMVEYFRILASNVL